MQPCRQCRVSEDHGAYQGNGCCDFPDQETVVDEVVVLEELAVSFDYAVKIVLLTFI